MGNPRPKPQLLSEKLNIIREYLKLSKPQMAQLLRLNHCGRVSVYENGQREPKLETVLAYAYAAKVRMASIVDDEVSLSEFRDQLGTFERAQIEIENANHNLPVTPQPETVTCSVYPFLYPHSVKVVQLTASPVSKFNRENLLIEQHTRAISMNQRASDDESGRVDTSALTEGE